MPNWASPMRLMLIAAFVSLSRVVWQQSQVQLRCLSARPVLIVPHTWQALLEGAHRPIFTTVVPALLATHSKIDTNSAKARSETFRPHRRFIPQLTQWAFPADFCKLHALVREYTKALARWPGLLCFMAIVQISRTLSTTGWSSGRSRYAWMTRFSCSSVSSIGAGPDGTTGWERSDIVIPNPQQIFSRLPREADSTPPGERIRRKVEWGI